MDSQKEKSLLRSIAGSWANRRNFANFDPEEIVMFLSLQESGILTIQQEEDGSRWVLLTGTGRERLCELNRTLPS